MKCLEKDRTRRYDTANGLVSDIQRHLNNEPVVARPPSAAYRIQKLVRRNKLAFAAATAVVAALVIGLGISTWQFIEKSRAYQRAVAAEGQERSARENAQKAEARETQLRWKAEAQELAARQRAYASDMNLAQQALAVNNLGRAWELLNRHRLPGTVVSNQLSVASDQRSIIGNHARESDPLTTDNWPLTTDLRGWEWRYLWQQCQSEALFTLCRKSNSILSFAVSHDGSWLAIGEHDQGRLSLWDLRTWKEIKVLTSGETFVGVAFSPRAPLLAFSSEDIGSSNRFTVHLWNVTNQKSVANIPLGGECRELAFSGDGQTLITATRENQLSLWSVPEGKKLKSYPARALIAPYGTDFAVTRDLSLAVVRKENSRLVLLDLVTGNERWTNAEPVFSFALSPDDKALAAWGTPTFPGGNESVIRLLEVASGKEIGRALSPGRPVTSMVFWPDGKTLATAGGDDQTVCIWDLNDLTNPRLRKTLRGHKTSVWRLALLPDARTLVSACKDGSVYVWDTEAIRPQPGAVTVPGNFIDWRFLDNQSFLALDRQGSVFQWKGTSFREAEHWLNVGTNFFQIGGIGHWSTLISEDGHWLAVGAGNGAVQVWDLERRVRQCEFTTQAGRVLPAQFLERGKKLVVLLKDDGALEEWDLATQQRTASWLGPAAYRRWSPTAFSTDGRRCFMIGFGGASALRDMAAGRDTSEQLDIKQASYTAFSPDGKLCAVASLHGFTKLFEVAPWREVGIFQGFVSAATSLAFSPDGQRLAATSRGQEAIKLWDVESRQELLTLEGQGRHLRPTAFSPDGHVLGSISAEGVLHLWRAPSWAEIEAAEKGK